MIKIENLSKSFGNNIALDDVTMTIEKGSIYGLIGSNGSGKSTLMRILAGVYKENGGSLRVDDAKVFENPVAKEQTFFIPDEPYIPSGATMVELVDNFVKFYPNFDKNLFERAAQAFGLDIHCKLSSFSKGMQRQAHIIVGLAAGANYLLCDETFDGLDPVKRQGVKRLLADLVADGEHTVIIASHNLRELEDICDQIGLLHQGKLILQKDINDLCQGIYNVQIALPSEEPTLEDFSDLNVVSFHARGRMAQLIVRGNETEIVTTLDKLKPVYLETLSLTLEEVFIAEMEVLGYDLDGLIL